MTNIWNIYAKIYDQYIGNSEKDEELFNYITQFLNKDDILYDGACGTGIFSIELSKHVKQIYACDLSENMIAKTDEKIKKQNIHNIKTKIDDITNIGYEDNTFDAAITPNVIHLLDNPDKTLKELKRIVKKDGIIIIPTYITKVQNKYLEKIGKIVFALVGFKPNSWTEKQYINILQDNDMNIIEYKTFNLKEHECTVIIKNK